MAELECNALVEAACLEEENLDIDIVRRMGEHRRISSLNSSQESLYKETARYYKPLFQSTLTKNYLTSHITRRTHRTEESFMKNVKLIRS